MIPQNMIIAIFVLTRASTTDTTSLSTLNIVQSNDGSFSFSKRRRNETPSYVKATDMWVRPYSVQSPPAPLLISSPLPLAAAPAASPSVFRRTLSAEQILAEAHSLEGIRLS
jgi:hypothetical protein